MMAASSPCTPDKVEEGAGGRVDEEGGEGGGAGGRRMMERVGTVGKVGKDETAV